MGPLLWNIYINDLFNLVSCARAYADDVTLSLSFAPGEERTATTRLNAFLRRLEDWGHKWQVSFAPKKIQLLVVSWATSDIRLVFNRATLTLQSELQSWESLMTIS